MKLLLKNFEQFLFYFLFFAIPFQTRKILYSSGWYFNEWQSVTLYATDILLIVLFLFWIFSAVRSSKFTIYNLQFTNKLQILNFKQFLNFSISQFRKPDFYLVLFLAVALVSVKNSSDFFVGLFLWLKLVEFALLYFYLKTYAVRKFGLMGALYALIVGGVFQAVIAIGQFLKQGSLGLGLLGESVLGPGMTGIASFFVNSGLPAEALAKAGEKVIRAYGTTPHPNVLATYLFLAIFAYYFVYLYYGLSHGHRTISKRLDASLSVAYFLMLFGFFFTFSRTVVFLWLFGFVIRAGIILSSERFRRAFLYVRVNRIKLAKILFVSLAAIILLAVFYWPEVLSRLTLSPEEEAVRLRVFYNKESLGGGLNLFGIGLGDFTGWLMEQNPNLPSHVYQPVHNIYLLIYSEIGIIGFVLFLLFLTGLIYEFIKKTRLREFWHRSFLLVSLSILFIGLFDHFLLTLQQGRFVLGLSLALLTVLINYDSIRDTTTRRI